MEPTEEVSPGRPVHILFHGAGAVGCFYASQLHHPESNVLVSLNARSNFQAISENNIHLETRDFGEYMFQPWGIYKGISAAIPSSLDTQTRSSFERTETQAGNAPPEKWDVIVVSTKALPDQSPNDAETIAPLVTPGYTSILLIQNGVGIEAPMRDKFPTNPVLTGVTVVSAAQTSPGIIKQHRWTRLHLGPYGVNAPPAYPNEVQLDKDLKERGMAVARDLAVWWGSNPDISLHEQGGEDKKKFSGGGTHWGQIRDVEVLDATNIQCVRWHKVAMNASFNPSAVLCGGKGNAEMIQDEELRIHIQEVMEEVLLAAPMVLGLKDGKLPVRLGLAEPERILKSTERNVGAKPSMLLDWEAGRKMELEVILGNPVRMARACGVEMKRCGTMYALLKSWEQMRKSNKG